MRNIFFIQKEKAKSDDMVTLYYKEIVKKAFETSGFVVKDKLYGESFDKKDFFYVDTILDAIYYVIRGYKYCVLWSQGIVPEESYIRNSSKFRFLILSMIEKIVLKKSKFVFLVSEEMKKHYEAKYKINLSEKSFIMPCFNESEPIKGVVNIPQKYEKETFVYVGGIQAWQCFEKTVELYKKIEYVTENRTRFYVFTFDKNNAVKILDKYNVNNYEVDCVPKEELSKRIKQFKYGFILRENNIVNNVATPTKFSNYIANGIIPIYSSCIKSFAEHDEVNKLGIIYDFNNEEEGFNNIISHMQNQVEPSEVRLKCKKVFSDYYNSNRYIKESAEKLKKL